MSVTCFPRACPALLLIPALLFSAAASTSERIWVSGWRETAALNIPRAGAAVIAAGDYVYAIGGIDGQRFIKSVEFARIGGDGALTPWQPTAPLNEERGFFAAAVHDGYLYVAGGGNGENGKNLLRSTERAAIRRDGRLGSWERLDVMLTYPRRCVKLAVVGNALYALGGFGGTLLDSVERAEFLPDGRLGPFRLEDHALTMPRYINAAQTTQAAIYVLGGHNDREGIGRREVEYASPGASGAGLTWKPAAAMLRARYALSSAALGNYLYALGGLDGPVYIDAVEVSRIGRDGTLAPWRATTALSSPRANFGTFEQGGRVYVVGGTNRDGYFRSVEYAEHDERGDLGFWASADEATAYERRRAAAAAAHLNAESLPNEGVVEEIVQTDVYSYIRVTGRHGEQWLAAPRTDYAVKDRIRYSRGMAMANFYSRALGRSFEAILFVEDTARLE